MSTGLLEQRATYPRSQYEYGPAKGYNDVNGNGRKEIDCSGLLYRMLQDAGYTIPYLTTGQLNTDTTHFDVIPLANVEPGDIALWINFHGHTGVIERINSERNAGDFYGSQTSSGPASAKYGHGSGFWPMPEKFLRPKPQFRTGAQPAPVAQPAPAPAPAGPAPLMNFQYPFRKADGKQFTDAEEVYKVLEAEKSGHYLLGSHKFWHGGIHISDASAPQCILNEPIRCMADGEVVAYRLNEDYLESTFGENEKKLKYSNSFCLVRHEYKSAPNPEEGANKGKQNKLNFYSLYMHLLPYKRYPLSENETPKPKVTMTVNDFKAYDDFPESSPMPFPGKLSTGTKLEVLEQRDLGNVTYAKGKILTGSVKNGTHKVREAGAEVWFAYLKDGAPYQNSKPQRIWNADPIPERAEPNYWQGKVKATVVNKLDLYGAPASPQNGQPAGDRLGTMQLISGSVVEFDSKEVLNLNVAGTIRRMAKCTKVSGDLAATGAVPESFWACVENAADYRILNWTSLTPTSFDSVETASTGIKAGDPIGYLGQTENLTGEDGGVTSKHQVHVEIFTAEADVKDFLKNVAGLKIGKQYLHLAVGAELKKKAPVTGTTSLKNEHAVDLGKAPVVKEGTEDWYDVSVIEDDQPVTGLVKKTGAEIITQHDWEKLGFQIVEESNATADGFLDPEDMPQFFKDLFAKIDKNHDGDVDPGELAEALKNADTRDHWAKLVAHHPTEWKDKADAAKWRRLDQLLESAPKTLKHEKERISKYVFWEELSGKAAMNTELIWHFHPIEFISNMKAKKTCDCNAVVNVTRWVSSSMTHYGPLHTGDKELGSAPQWDELVARGKITADEKNIIVVMSGNEAKINGVQSYDSEIITAGAMQKTVKVSGLGELANQVKKFKDQYPDAYTEFFESKGWKLDEAGSAPKMYYQGEARANGAKLEGEALRSNLGLGCSEATFGQVIDCQPVSVMACAISSPLYVEIQIMDFIDRLHSALEKVPTGYSFAAEKLLKSPLGKAVILDHDINRPGFVKDDLGSALDTFFAQNPTVSRNVDTWGATHSTYERKVLELYGNSRRMTNPTSRYNHLKAGL
ncbi:EF-hand domain-containing protein [Pseudomonas sp. 681]|uniref:EF-hand domain-containing protein n=1 Tax=Pseudomonas fungipugnans TaxID=3024217 RepID=A0ABT6QPK8_9PSED|nr:EF-hand domain-containing protein [Pseudomonas sp. 681]MDI2592786.1 EF-hand domain-containing protein [Pseudomonas sp. 681]